MSGYDRRSSSSSQSSASTTSSADQSDQHLLGNAAVADSMEHDHGHDHGHDHDNDLGVEPTPEEEAAAAAALDADRPVGGDIDADLRARLMARLQALPASQDVLEEIETARGDLAFSIKWSNQGSYHRSGAIHLDRHNDEADFFGTMAHELVHLCTFVSGNAANAATMGREEFVNAKMNDEIDAHSTSFIAHMQAGQFSGELGLADFSDWLTQNHPELMVSDEDPAEEAANWAAVKAHATTWLEDKYRNEWVTSNSHENYYTYWGGAWDRAHPSP